MLNYCNIIRGAPTVPYAWRRMYPLLAAVMSVAIIIVAVTSQSRFGRLETTPLVCYQVAYVDELRAV